MDKLLKTLFDFITSNRFVKFLVAVAFIFAWIEFGHSLGVQLANNFVVYIGTVFVLVPAVLLVAILQYQSKIAYLISFGVFVYAFFTKILDLNYLLNLYWSQNPDEGILGMINQYSFCVICEIKTAIRLMVAFTFAICFMAQSSLLEDFALEKSVLLKLLFIIFILRLLVHFI